MAERKAPAPKAKTKSAPAKPPAAARRKPAASKPNPKAAKKPPAAGAANHGSQDDSLYTNPGLRARLKKEIQAGSKGGRAGQWSARKSQLLVHAYEEQGGGYANKEHAPQQKNLEHWTGEKWTTADGKKAVAGKETARYLPAKAWEQLSPAEKKATDAKKRAASKRGEQFVANTEPAKRARRKATKKD